MLTRFLQVVSVFMLLAGALLPAEADKLLLQLKEERQKIEQIRAENLQPTASSKEELARLRQNIDGIKSRLQAAAGNLDQPVFFQNDVELDENLTLVDFYLYEYTADSYQVFCRLKNRQNIYLEWVKIRFNFFKDGLFTGTDDSYVDFESYGSSGISPYNFSFINTFVGKYDFNSIEFEAEYQVASGESDVLWDQVLTLQSVTIKPSGNFFRWQGQVRNNYSYSLTFPVVYACILKDNRMIALDYAYLNVVNFTMPPNSTKTFDSYIELPADYDEIQYFIKYALYSPQGSGNLPPNKPIFTSDRYYGKSRVNTSLNLFVIDPEQDNIDLSVDFGDGYLSPWAGSFVSGQNAAVQHPYANADTFFVRAQAKDAGVITAWSAKTAAIIEPSSFPVINTPEIDPARYQKYYSLPMQASGGIVPLLWQMSTGTLPDGLALDAAGGILSGTPAQSGIFNFTLLCSDAGFPAAADSVALSLEVKNQQPDITSPDTLAAIVKTPIVYQASAVDSDSNAITFRFFDYPDWLSPAGAEIRGTAPNQVLQTSFTLVATDGDLADTVQVVLLIRAEELAIPAQEIREAVYLHPYSDTLAVTGGLAPYSWFIVNGQLPNGLQLVNNGIFSGIPARSGSFPITVQVKDSDKPFQADSLALLLHVRNQAPRITSPDSISIQKPANLVYLASADDPDGNPIHFSFLNYPSWLAVTDAQIHGDVPATAADSSFTLFATDGDLADTLEVKITVKEPAAVEEKSLPERFYISANYPNPFNAGTTIRIDLPASLDMTLLVYDLNGKQVDVLYAGRLNAGSHAFTWNAARFSSGIYFIIVRSERINRVVKCTLLK